MCTVSFYKAQNHVIITSNRDENINRPIALPPTKMAVDHSVIYCPIDPQHNGTWFAVNPIGSVFVLLNGADKKHTPNPPYKRSRGLVLLEIAAHSNYIDKWNSIDLEHIENFTIVAYFKNKLAQLRWDGNKKSHQFLNENDFHIWSSTTLYDESTIKKREEWFIDFLASKNASANSNDIAEFHINSHKEDPDNGLIINRSNKILTKNITQAIVFPDQFTLQHWDLIQNYKTILKEQFQ